MFHKTSNHALVTAYNNFSSLNSPGLPQAAREIDAYCLKVLTLNNYMITIQAAAHCHPLPCYRLLSFKHHKKLLQVLVCHIHSSSHRRLHRLIKRPAFFLLYLLLYFFCCGFCRCIAHLLSFRGLGLCWDLSRGAGIANAVGGGVVGGVEGIGGCVVRRLVSFLVAVFVGLGGLWEGGLHG